MKQENTMLKTISKLLILLAVWSAFYALVLPLYMGEKLILHDVLIAFWDGHYHLWYLFMLIGLHLITPILRTFVKKQTAKIVLYFIALACVFQYLPPIVNFFMGNSAGRRNCFWNMPINLRSVL